MVRIALIGSLPISKFLLRLLSMYSAMDTDGTITVIVSWMLNMVLTHLGIATHLLLMYIYLIRTFFSFETHDPMEFSSIFGDVE